MSGFRVGTFEPVEGLDGRTAAEGVPLLPAVHDREATGLDRHPGLLHRVLDVPDWATSVSSYCGDKRQPFAAAAPLTTAPAPWPGKIKISARRAVTVLEMTRVRSYRWPGCGVLAGLWYHSPAGAPIDEGRLASTAAPPRASVKRESGWAAGTLLAGQGIACWGAACC